MLIDKQLLIGNLQEQEKRLKKSSANSKRRPQIKEGEEFFLGHPFQNLILTTHNLSVQGNL